MLHTLNVPDALITWGKETAAAEKWPRSWGHEVERLVMLGEKEPLTKKQVTTLLSRLEALIAAAARANRVDLLKDLDLFTAEWLGLEFELQGEGEPVTIGRDAQWNYREIRVLLATGTPKERVAFATEAKRLVADVFPGARIDAMMRRDEHEGCFGCGEMESTVMLTLDTGSRYCPSCWAPMIHQNPLTEED